jgi:hypothetical protein
MPVDKELTQEVRSLTEDLNRLLAQGNKLHIAQQNRIDKLYARNDALEALLRRNNIPVPDWNSPDTSSIKP